jgi:hypothetical protein
MQEPAKVNEFMEYIKRLNTALDSVGYGGRFIPATFAPRFGIIIGPKAKMIVSHLYSSGKVEKYYEFKGKKSRGKVFAVEFYD